MEGSYPDQSATADCGGGAREDVPHDALNASSSIQRLLLYAHTCRPPPLC